jgi:hypothetical protein
MKPRKTRKTDSAEPVAAEVPVAAPAPIPAEPVTKPDAENLRSILLANVAKLLAAIRQTAQVAPQFQRGDKYIRSEIANAVAVQDSHGIALPIGPFRAYLIRPEQTSEFNQDSNREFVLDFGSGIFVALVQV